MAMIENDLVIFDCDGVLVDSEVLSCSCLSDALAAHGIDLDVQKALELFVGRNVAAVCRSAATTSITRSIPALLSQAVRR